jgi:hypothetical protein
MTAIAVHERAGELTWTMCPAPPTHPHTHERTRTHAHARARAHLHDGRVCQQRPQLAQVVVQRQAVNQVVDILWALARPASLTRAHDTHTHTHARARVCWLKR